jgi:dihydroceramidase
MQYTYSFVYRDPVYHQFVFATIMLASLSRETYLLTWSEASRTIPDKKKATIVEVLRTGLFMFLFGFFVWNLDNIFCDFWTRIKQAVGWPIAFFMEGRFVERGEDYALLTNTFTGHAWWHVLTVSEFHNWLDGL